MGYLYKTGNRNVKDRNVDRNVKDNSELKEFCSNTDVIPSLKPRDALFGGSKYAA